MPYNSRSERRSAIRNNKRLFELYLHRFVAFAHNSVQFENLGETPKRYIMRVLINEGAIAYDKETGLFLRFVPIGYNIYGLPESYQLYGYNGFTVQRKPNEVVILRINDIQQPIKPYLKLGAERVVQFDTAIYQNLEAIRTMTVYECESDAQALSIINQAESRRVGATMFFANKNAFGGSSVKSSSTNAQYLVDKLQEARQKVLNEIYESLGMSVANTEKRERVQNNEIYASNARAIDSLLLNVDTFNYDAEYGGLDIRMIPNMSSIDLFNKEETENEIDKQYNNKDKEYNNTNKNVVEK